MSFGDILAPPPLKIKKKLAKVRWGRGGARSINYTLNAGFARLRKTVRVNREGNIVVLEPNGFFRKPRYNRETKGRFHVCIVYIYL